MSEQVRPFRGKLNEPNEVQAQERTILDKLVASGWLNWEKLIWLAIIVLAVVTRLWDLAPKAMHHDESIHAKFSYDMFKGVSIYRYDPTWHGPVLYYMVTLAYFLLGGATEFSARFAPAMFGIGLVAICWFLRPLIGRIGAVVFAVLMLVSPSVLYYSRSLRHDIFATFGTLLFVIGLFRYAQAKPGEKLWWMGASGVGFFILFGSHEMSFFTLAIVLSWLGIIFLLEIVGLPAWIRRRQTTVTAEGEVVYADRMPRLKPLGRRFHRRPIEAGYGATDYSDDELDEPEDSDGPDASNVTRLSLQVGEIEGEVIEEEERLPRERRDPLLGSFRLIYFGLLALCAALVLLGSIHLFTDKGPNGQIQQLLGLNAYLILIPFYLLLAAALCYPVALLVNYGYNRLSERSNRIGRIVAVGILVVGAGLATALFLRGKSPVGFVAAVNSQLTGNTNPAVTQAVKDGYTTFNQYSYGGLSWPSLLPQLVFLLVAALLAGALGGWLVERGFLLYTERGLYGFGIAASFVMVLATLISLRFVLVADRTALPKVTLPALGLVDKWLAYVLGGAILALIIGGVAGWFVSLSERIPDEELRGSAILRAVLKFARQPRALLYFLLGFGILYILIFSNFFFAPERLADGFYRGLEYWGEQHGKRRLDEPWFYYPMLMLLYEIVATVFVFVALFYFPISWWKRTARRERFIFSVRGVFIGLTFWWTFLALIFYSLAGEKIPWLNIQIALPASLASAAFFNEYLGRLNWRRVLAWKEGLLFAGLFATMFTTVVVLIGMAINFPRQNNQINAGLGRAATSSDTTIATIQMILVGLLGLGVFGLALWLWWSDRLSGQIARAVIVLLFGSILFAYTVKSTIALNFDHPDVAVEPMIYTQTTPEVPLFVERLGRLARDLRDTYKTVPATTQPGQDPAIYPDPANSRGIPLYVSSEVAWPLSWYLRDYTNVAYGTVNADVNAPAVIDKLTDSRGNNFVVIMVSSGENTTKLQEQLQGQYTAHQYRFRWNFPEDDSSYGGLGLVPPEDTREYRIAVKDIINTRWDMFVRSFTEQPFAGRLWRYIMYRELWLPLNPFDMVVYVRNDIDPDFALTGGTATAGATGQAPAAFDLTASTQAGNRNGQYRTPRNVAVAPNGDVLVLDSLNGRVQRFDKEGRFISKFGTIGKGDGQFTLSQYESGPSGLTTDEDGNVYVTDTWGFRIVKFDKNGTFVQNWGTGGQDTQGDAALSQQYPTSFYGPRSIAYDRAAGEFYITDTGNKRVVVYDKTGQFKRQFGTKGAGQGQFDEPVSVALGPDGRVYVVDLRNKRIQILDKQGAYQSEIAVPSWREQVLNEPYLAFDAGGDLYATDPANGAVLRFDKTGQLTKTYNTQSGLALLNPVGLTFDTEGNLYIADARRNSIVKTKP